MSKEIIVVYQDCVLCGNRGEKKRQYLAKKGLNIRKVSAFSSEGEKLVHKAVFNHKMGSLPFYTDGERFSYHVETFLEKKTTKKSTSKTRKAKKVKEIAQDESNSTN